MTSTPNCWPIEKGVSVAWATGVSLGVAVAEGVVGERSGSALGVVDHGGFEQRAVG